MCAEVQALPTWVDALSHGLVGVEVPGADVWVSSVELLQRDHSPLQKQLLLLAEHLGFSSGSLSSNPGPVRMQLVLCFLHQHSAYRFVAGGDNLS